MTHKPTIYFDVTMLVESRGPAHGILRVQRETAQRVGIGSAAVVPCCYDQRKRCFRVVSNWPEVMADRDSHRHDGKGPRIGHPADWLTPLAANRRPFVRGLLYSQSFEVRAPLIRAFDGVLTVRRELGLAARYIAQRRNRVQPRYGEKLAYGQGDVLVQPGAQGFGIAIDRELMRAKQAGTHIVTVVYDAIPVFNPELVGPSSTRAFTDWLRVVLQTSRSILAISKKVKTDIETLAREWNIPCPPVSVLRLGDDAFPPPPTAVSAELAALALTPFVVCLGTIEIRKNHRLLTQVWRRLAREGQAPRLVIVGKKGWLVEETMSVLERDLTIKPYVTVVQGASDTDLAWLVSKSQFTVFPSMVEGWGLPVGECLAAGKIVIASDDPAIIEAGQGVAIHLPPDDVLAWTETVRALSADDERRARLEADIRARFKVHPWRRTAEDFAEHIRLTIEPRAIGQSLHSAATAAPAIAE